MTRWISLMIFAWSAVALSACGGGTGSPNNTQQPFFAEFDPAAGVIPFPNNVLFSGSTDGTLNIPLNPATFNPADPYADPTAAMNTLDGFSTSAPITESFNLALDAASIDPYSVQMFEVTVDIYSAVTGVTRKLAQGADYLAMPSPSSPNTLVIKPLRPLKSNTHYLVVLTNGLKSVSGIPASSSLTFEYLKRTMPLVDANGNSLIPADNVSAAKLEGLRLLTQAMLGAAAAQGVNPANVVLAWTFKTQTINKVLAKIEQQSFTDPYATDPYSFIAPPAAPSAATGNLGVLDFYSFAKAQAAAGNTALIDGYKQGLFNNLGSVVIGAVKLPYYLNAAQSPQDTAPLTGFFQTDAYGMPALKSVQTVPFLLTVPNSPGSWPVVIFQHGFTVDKAVVFGIADALAKAGYAVISIDAVLHGDRTFGLDLVTETYDPVNKTMVVTANVPDGVPDSSGTHYLNLGHLLTARDNIRQSVADLIHLTRLIENQAMDVVNNGTGQPGADGAPDLVNAVAGFVGHSNGGILGTMLAAVEPNISRFVLANPGGVYSDILQNSVEISPKVNAGLAAKGVTVGSPEYAKFFLAAQTVVDDADPFNYAPLKQAGAAVLLFKQKGDRVVPNMSTDLLAGAFGLPQVAAGAGSWPVVLPSPFAGSGFVHFLAGTHSSFLKPDPYAPPATLVGLDVITEMQTETAAFLSSGQIVITNATGPLSGLPIVE